MTKNLRSSHHLCVNKNYLLSPQFKIMAIYYRGETDFSIPKNVSRGCCRLLV